MRLSQILAAVAATTVLLLVVVLVVAAFDGCATTEPQARDTESTSDTRDASRAERSAWRGPEVTSGVSARLEPRARGAVAPRAVWTAALIGLTTPPRAVVADADACTDERGTCRLDLLDAEEGLAFTFRTADGEQPGEPTEAYDVEGAPIDALRLRALGLRVGDALDCAFHAGPEARCGREAYVFESAELGGGGLGATEGPGAAAALRPAP